MLRLLTMACAGGIRLGALVSDYVIDINRVDPDIPPDLHALVTAADTALSQARRATEQASAAYAEHPDTLLRDAVVHPLNDVHVLAPLVNPRRNVFCVGRNYLDHAAEGARARGVGFKLPEYPQFFTKPAATVVGPDGRLPIDERVTQKLDYEIELAIVIGRRGRDIAREEAYDHVFGYTIGNDISARDQQQRHGQWFKGKALDGSCPLGPVVVPHSDIDPHALNLRLYVNGELRQSATTAAMLWKVPDIIYWLSQGTTIEPGDVILTGTPEGVGNAMTPPTYLRPGDTIEAHIDGLGSLRTHIVSHAPVTAGLS